MPARPFAVAALFAFAVACGEGKNDQTRPGQSSGPRSHALTVTVSGGGTVTSAPGGIDCGATCTASFAEGTQVMLSTSTPAGTVFSDWDGACSGTGVCVVAMTKDQTATARFSALPPPQSPPPPGSHLVTVTIEGSGRVASDPAGLDCSAGSCAVPFTDGTALTLNAAAATGWTFAGFDGGCHGKSCVVTVAADTQVLAHFDPTPPGALRITTVTTGTGQDPDGYTFAVDGGPLQPIGVNAVASLPNVAAGGHSVQLSGVAGNCVVEGTNPRAVTVSSGTAELGFAVTCTAGTPSASKSAVAASPQIVIIDSGNSTITVTVRDPNENLLGGIPVTLSSTGAGNAISPALATSGADGQATFTFSSTVAATKTITAMAGGVEITQDVTVTVRNRLELVSARDHIPGSFVNQRAVYADRDRIYLGAFQGSLFVLARDRASGFPIVQTIDLGTAITGVRGDDNQLYVTAGDGLLRVYAKTPSLSLVKTLALATFGLGTVEVFEGKIYVSLGQAQLAVDADRLYLAQLNPGEVALEVDKTTLQVTRTYGATFVANKTAVYDRLTGAQGTTIPYPANVFGVVDIPRLYSDGQSLMQTIAGCCGTGITILKAPAFTESAFIGALWTNAVIRAGSGFLSGTEAGSVGYFEQNQLIQGIDLRGVTGHFGSEDIEIRSVWADGLDDLVFAGSSWGNDASRSLSLPAFFVLSLK